MKTLLITIGCLASFSTFVNAETKCPEPYLIEDKIAAFSAKNGLIDLDGQSWNFESHFNPSEVSSIKSLNPEMSDIDEGTCNYLVYLTDSTKEDASLLLHQRGLKKR